MRRASIALAAVTIIASVATGQLTEPAPEADIAPQPATEVAFDLTAGVWLPRLGGSVRLGSGARSISVEDDLDLDGSESIFNGEVTARFDDDWQLRLNGFDFSTSTDGTFEGVARFGDVELSPGDRYRSSVDLLSGSIELGRDFLRGPRGEAADLRFTGRVGIRYTEVEQELILIGGGREDPDGSWVAPIVGVEMNLRLDPGGWPINLQAGAAAGPAFGDDVGWLWQVRANATVEITPNAALLFGYRLLELSVSDGDYDFDAGLQGLFLGGALRF